jgi:hypothetical protein
MRRRNFARSYDVFAQHTASTLVPEASATDYDGMSFSDTWHTAGEDGYRSAMFHAAVRCRELQQATGLEPQDFVPTLVEGPSGSPGLIFHGQRHASDSVLCAPELVRLHSACLLFSELCSVSSPLQDTLCFLLRELCQCIFQNFCPGIDILLLTPFFVSAIQAGHDLAKERQRAQELERDRDDRVRSLVSLQAEVEQLKEEMRVIQESSEKSRSDCEASEKELSQLKEEVAMLHQVGEIRSDELRELGTV